MILLGLVLLVLGYLVPVPPIVTTLGWILLVIGLILLILGVVGHPAGGHRYWF